LISANELLTISTQPLAAQPLDQHTTNPEPERIATGQHHNPQGGRQGGEGVTEGNRVIADQALLVVGATAEPIHKLGQQAFWRCQQVSVLHQVLVHRW
jgi:hypothetical protein